MRNKKRTILSLLLVMALGMSLFMTACKDSGDDIDEPAADEGIVMTLNLPSDSDNGNEWELDQSSAVFDTEVIFLDDEGSDDGSGEVQSFEMRPVQAGATTLTFKNKSTDTTYTYEAEVSGDKSNITIKSSKGESAGAEAEAPEPVIENN